MAQDQPNESCPTAAGKKISVQLIDAWASSYSTTRRQLWRWIKIGREKGKPCPLHEPAQMPDWWTSCMTWSVPAKIWEVARRSPGDKTQGNANGFSPQKNAVVDVRQFDLSSGEAVRRQRQIVAALFDQQDKAYLSGDAVDHIQTRCNKALEQLRKLEKDEREHLQSIGEYRPRAEVERDYTEAAIMLRQMRDSMERQIIELCPWLTAEERPLLAAAVQRVRSQEDRVFQKLPSLKSNDDLLADLAA